MSDYEISLPMALAAHLTRVQRTSLATLLTLAGVAGMEVAHFNSGTSPVLESGYFVIPGVVAIAFFETWRQRAIAFLLLTIVGLVGVGTAIYAYLILI